MPKFSASFVLVVAAVYSMAAGAAEFTDGEVLVKFKDGAVQTRKEMQALYTKAGVKSVNRLNRFVPGLEHLTLKDGVTVDDALAALRTDGAVEYAQPNYVIRALPIMDSEQDGSELDVPCVIPGINFPPGCSDSVIRPRAARPDLKPAPDDVDPPAADPDLSMLYGMPKIGATEAWKEWIGTKDFLVGDVDTGIDYNHQDLAFNVWRNPNPGPKNDVVGWDVIHNDGLPYDDNKHGTHTAGTIGAVGGNGKGIAGVSQRVSIMALKFLSSKGQGDTAGAIKAIAYAVDHGARILNNSWGGPRDADNAALGDAIKQAGAKGVLFVVAAGNGDVFGRPQNVDITGVYPASFGYDNMITVAATDSKDGIAKFSNYGKNKVHLGAPGVDVYSTVPGDKYAKFSGTSMACPHVVGAAALIWSKHPEWTVEKVKEVLLTTVDPLTSLKGKTVTGGRLNVLKALHSTE